MYAAGYRKFRGILYLFPSRADVTEFVKGPLDLLIEENPDTLGRWLQETDSANIKQIWNYLSICGSNFAEQSKPIR